MFHETLADFGATPTFNPPPGWTVTSTEEVTTANQDQFRVDEDSAARCADIKSFMIARADVNGFTYYVPPVGWWLITLTQPDGEFELLWVRPDGFPWLAQVRCTNDAGSMTSSGAGGGGAKPPVLSLKSGFPWWLALLAGGGYLAYKHWWKRRR